MNKSTEEKRQKESTEDPKPAVAFTTDLLKLIPSNYQHVGVRERQEDSFAFSDLSDQEFVDKHGVLAVVADGMGGLARGDRASQIAVSFFLQEHANMNSNDQLDLFMQRALKICNYAVYDLAFENEKDIELGTTLVAALVHQGKLTWVSSGDSRIYLYHDKQVRQLSTDHVYANHLENDVENGLITEKEAEEHPERSYLTGYLGLPELVEMDCCDKPVVLEPGDAVVLCSDGLTNALSEKEISKILDQSNDNLAENLVKKALAKKKKHQDNITVLVLSCEKAD